MSFQNYILSSHESEDAFSFKGLASKRTVFAEVAIDGAILITVYIALPTAYPITSSRLDPSYL